MARVTTYLLASTITPDLDVGLFNLNRAVAVANAAAASGDYMPVATINRAGRIVGADLTVSATLGASCTVQLALYRAGALVRALTAASGAGAASYSNSNALGPIDAQAGDEIVLVVAGAAVGAAATVTADVQLQH